MSGPWAFLTVAVGGGIGAAARFWVADTITTRRRSAMPRGTIAVNVLGSFLVGVITGLVLTVGTDAFEPWRLFLATGICGGFTTFSTATVESVTLARGGHPLRALANTLGTLAATVPAVAAGIGVVVMWA
ncbi:Camphor resistance CrcB protein [Xylanimonas cellulosilytica DSM 15894]|uniref:Fluoride-specific ion channel FluC n=1 Tax=Xylanimonas cellulosilytica (strain DSM 15894 / JCM 12276 / CECT 5975 / KCTC 9989 / LMG 20990 / NBRC 107835 / XIL07) TaxID=446471 RepID=D1BRL6_XYLCX|nr:fluoride efflux transporter CrcB [Xylanimonas cellulosilytica]ACZ32282.1 Camphor resistance CrcB protein [Xylanimonas cellulosilytica DSM 15894]